MLLQFKAPAIEGNPKTWRPSVGALLHLNNISAAADWLAVLTGSDWLAAHPTNH